jgi:beta-lactamase class A
MSEFEVLFEKVMKNETPEEKFEEFLAKRLSGAEKIQAMTEKKGGYSTLTAIHYKAKLKPYAESEKWAEKDGKEKHYKTKAKEVYAKLKDLDSLSQKQFQSLMGELEVWGEVYIRATKPDSIKL